MSAEKEILSLFDVKSDWLVDEICIWNIKEQLNKAVWNLGGPAKASKLINVKYSRLKEWHLGRKPIPLSKLNKLLFLIDETLKQELVNEINSKQLYLKCQYSNHTVKFPNELTPGLSYVVGLLLGDGYLAGDSSNKRGDWEISVFFDNIKHLAIYKSYLKEIFGLEIKTSKPPKNYYVAHFASKSVHWFLRSFFDLCNGYKADKITIPSRIIDTQNKALIAECIKGLFDSDGTVVVKNKKIKFASTSETIVNQLIFWLYKLGVNTRKSKWLKNNNCKMLFTASVHRKKDVARFAEIIGFNHPEKKKRLYKICDPSILQIAPLSSGQGVDAIKASCRREDIRLWT